MPIIVYLLFVSIILGLQKAASENSPIASSGLIDPLTDQSIIDELWIGHMIVAPVAINLLGQLMVAASADDVSLERYSSGHVYQYIKYPQSFRATLLQISNECYRAFLTAHSSMNQIQLYIKQIPQHVETTIKILSSNASANLVSRLLPRSINNIGRIGEECISLANDAEHSFMSLLNLIGELLEIVKEKQGGSQTDRNTDLIETNNNDVLHSDIKREEQQRRKQYKLIRETVRRAHQEYSQALKDIPTGFKSVAFHLGRAVIRVLSVFKQSYILSTTDQDQLFGTTQIINFASRFAETLNSLIEISLQNVNQTRNLQELQSYKIVFRTYINMINIFSQNNLSVKARDLIQRGILLVDQSIQNKDKDITGQLQILANDLKPFLAAEQLSSLNNAPISVPEGRNSSNNGLLEVRLARERLSQTEQRLDKSYANNEIVMKQINRLTKKFARLDLRTVKFTKLIEMLEEVFGLFVMLQKNWSFSSRVLRDFGEKLKTFVSISNSSVDAEASIIDRKIILQFLKEDSTNVYHQSYVLYVLSHTCYHLSNKYLMPRLGDLSTIFATTNDNQRQQLRNKLKEDTKKVQKEVKELIKERKRFFQKSVNDKRAEMKKVIAKQDEHGNEEKIIEQAKRFHME